MSDVAPLNFGQPATPTADETDWEAIAAEMFGEAIDPQDSDTPPEEIPGDDTPDDDEEDLPTEESDEGDDDEPTADDNGAVDDADEPVITPTDYTAPVLTPEQSAALARAQEFDNLLRTNPEFQQHIVNWLQSQGQPAANLPTPNPFAGWQQTPTPPPAAPTLPSNLDLDDPAVQAILPIIQAQQAQLAQQAEILARTQQTSNHYAQEFDNFRSQQLRAVINRAKGSFQKQHDLSNADIDRLYDIAGRMGVAASIMQGVDPVTGAAVRPDPLYAVDRALELAYASTPEFQAKEQQRVSEQRKVDTTRKRKLAAISGGSGSSPRTGPSTPATESERRAAMVAEVAESMFGPNSATN